MACRHTGSGPTFSPGRRPSLRGWIKACHSGRLGQGCCALAETDQGRPPMPESWSWTQSSNPSESVVCVRDPVHTGLCSALWQGAEPVRVALPALCRASVPPPVKRWCLARRCQRFSSAPTFCDSRIHRIHLFKTKYVTPDMSSPELDCAVRAGGASGTCRWGAFKLDGDPSG